MFERFNERARRVLFFARYECSQVGSPSIETEHVLLGLIREPTGLLATILSTPPASLDGVRTELQRRIATTTEKIPPSVEIPFSAQAKRALIYTTEEADRARHSFIGPEHMLLGLLREQGAVAAEVLEQQGLRLDGVRHQVMTTLKDRPTTAADPEALDRIATSIRQLVDELATTTAGIDRKMVLVEQIQELLDSLRGPL